MYQSKKPYLYGTGRRKSSVARVHLFPNGTGAITINGRDIDEYFGSRMIHIGRIWSVPTNGAMQRWWLKPSSR